MSRSKILCVYCGRDATERPVWIEATCWRCWYEMYGRAQAVRQWKARRWWRRLVP